MRRGLPVLTVLILGGSAALFAQSASQSQESQKPAAQAAAAPAAPAFVIPAEYAKKPNPVKATPESISEGKKMYGYDCAMCHGQKGDGKGDLAADMKTPMLDFRDPKGIQTQTDGELFYVIKNGKGEMPAEGTRAKPEQVWDMVNYVRSLSKKETAEKK